MFGWRPVRVRKAKKQQQKKQHEQQHVASVQAAPMVICSRVRVVLSKAISAVKKVVKIVHVALKTVRKAVPKVDMSLAHHVQKAVMIVGRAQRAAAMIASKSVVRVSANALN